MINEIKINNFKSINDLTLNLGRFNVLIGSNGSGKSNILEAIAFGGAASADRLDNEYLAPRGIRPAEEKLMKNGISEYLSILPIQLTFKNDNKNYLYTIQAEKSPFLKWFVKEKKDIEYLMKDFLNSFIIADIDKLKQIDISDDEEKNNLLKFSQYISKQVKDDNDKKAVNNITENVTSNVISEMYKQALYSEELANFIIYSPELTYLRSIEAENQIIPLGIKGEGLFNILQIFYNDYNDNTINELKNYLHMIDWFDNFNAVDDKVTGRKSLLVKDRFLPNTILNQSNVNEGFLFIMFYASLFLSKETPTFFAIDNIEASFHPHLCTEITKNLVKLSKEHNKQVIITTHNPFVLDGLDLHDAEQKLFVVRRNGDGETITDTIDKQPKDEKLSEKWMRRGIGGHPETF